MVRDCGSRSLRSIALDDATATAFETLAANYGADQDAMRGALPCGSARESRGGEFVDPDRVGPSAPTGRVDRDDPEPLRRIRRGLLAGADHIERHRGDVPADLD